MADRVGRRAVLAGGLLGGAVRLALMAVTTDPVLVAVLVGVGGLVDGACAPALSAAVADRTPPDRLARGFGAVRAARTAGLALGPVFGAALVSWSFAAILALAAGLRAAAALVASATLRDHRGTDAAGGVGRIRPSMSSRAFTRRSRRRVGGCGRRARSPRSRRP